MKKAILFCVLMQIDIVFDAQERVEEKIGEKNLISFVHNLWSFIQFDVDI